MSLMGESAKDNYTFNSKLFYRSSVRGTPGAVVQGNVESSDARLSEKELLFITQAKEQIDSDASLLLNFLLD